MGLGDWDGKFLRLFFPARYRILGHEPPGWCYPVCLSTFSHLLIVISSSSYSSLVSVNTKIKGKNSSPPPRIYVRMYVCMYVCVCVCVDVPGILSMYLFVFMCVSIYACMYACMYVCVHVRMYVCMYVWMYACMHACMHVCM